MISADILSLLASDTGCAVYSRQGKILRANDEFCRILNLPPEVLCGKDLWELYVDLREEDFQGYVKSFQVGRAVEESAVFQGGDIRQRPVSTVTLPFRSGGEVHYLLFIGPFHQRFENEPSPIAAPIERPSRKSLPAKRADAPEPNSSAS